MAQCQADHTKKHSTSRFDLYGGIFSGQMYGSNPGSNGHVGRMTSCPSFRMSGGGGDEKFGLGFGDENGTKTVGLGGGGFTKAASESPNGYHHSGGYGNCGGYGAAAAPNSGGLDRRRSTGGILSQTSLEVSPPPPSKATVQSTRSMANFKDGGGTGTPPFHSHSRKSSAELSDRGGSFHAKGADPFAYGEIIRGVGNMFDDHLSTGTGSSKSGDLGETGSGSSKGRSPRAESPKSIGSSSSGGSANSSSGSPVPGRIVNFGNILPSGAPPGAATAAKNGSGSSPCSTHHLPAASFSGRAPGIQTATGALMGHAPLPVPTSGALRGNRRSNSWDYATGGAPGSQHKVAHARSGSEAAAVGRGSLSTSPSGSGSLGGSPSTAADNRARALGGSNTGTGGGDNRFVRHALASMDAEEVKNAGNELYRKGQFAEALNLYDKAVFLAPDKAPYRSNRAAALTGLGRLSEAVQESLQAIRMDPNFARAHHRLGCLYLRLGLVDNATRHLRASGTQVEWADTQRSLAVEKHLRKCSEARRALDWNAVVRESDATIIAGADCSPQIMAFKAEALLKLHQPEAADAVMVTARRFEDTLNTPAFASVSSMVFLVQAQVDMTLGRFENAVSAAEKASQSAPSDFAATVMLRKARTVSRTRKQGNDLFKVGRFSEAVIAYGEGLESAPKNAVLLCNRAACRAKLNQWEKAVEDSTAALEAQPNYTKALLRRAQSYVKLERWEDASRDYEVLRRAVPGDAEVARALFDVQVELKRSRGEDTHKIRRFGGEVMEVVTNDQFQEAITAPGLAVVQFNTRWSERCRELSPLVELLCKRYLSITFLKVDVDDHPYLAKLEAISFVPTFKIFKNGSKVKELAGPTEEALNQALYPFGST